MIDPIALLGEIDGLRKLGITIGKNLLISDCSHLVLPYHRLLDEQRELRQGHTRIGTTKRGLVQLTATKQRARACACPI